ncbi:phosphatase PAP2 family protein [Halomarina halobia]|uniref:Phosphatase PAP2 family protein n=1 Tax=Halomarina halobia TaxID=3033386 RepID=A0ABD6A6U3_9EURY|nr:phosphatase PAP2 family protein [Halomarina sp. PSR21]
MGLGDVLASVVVVSGAMLVIASLTIIGVNRLVETARDVRRRLRAAAPGLGLLVAVLLVNKIARDYGPEVSWLIGWNVTGAILGIEGVFVAVVQSFATPTLTAYFSFVYVYGYVFLLVFPLVAYLALERAEALQRTAVAYCLNYAIGLVCYTLFISYGPRNVMPELVDPLLYSTYPSSQLLTSQVNTNTNVFPSLHTSLSVTVALLAWETRDRYPRWVPVAAVLAASVVVSTMYLGIHWGTDVVAGIGLAVVSVRLSGPVLDRLMALVERRAVTGGARDAAGRARARDPEWRTARSDGNVETDGDRIDGIDGDDGDLIDEDDEDDGGANTPPVRSR